MNDQHEGLLGTELAKHVNRLSGLIQTWLQAGRMAVACGRWQDGGIAELLPEPKLELLPAVYDGCFVGVREIRLSDTAHHLHLDLGRVHRLQFAVAPSVCFGFRPAFEVRLLQLGPGDAPTDRWVVSLLLLEPYEGSALALERVGWFLHQAIEQWRAAPDLTEWAIDPALASSPLGQALVPTLRAALQTKAKAPWAVLTARAGGERGAADAQHALEPICLPLLQSALQLRAASLVLYREHLLVEFQTEQLSGVFRHEEAGHVSWQIGAFSAHHCHLALGNVRRVLFSAEPVSCQGYRLNYTVWFLTDGPCGNPWRRDGYFSVVLNHPYDAHGPLLDHIEPVFALYRAHAHLPWVSADAGFLQSMHEGPNARLHLNTEQTCLG